MKKEDDKMANSQETNHFNLEKLLPPKGWRFLIIILLAIGIFFRFRNLDKKVFWLDESMTALRVSGYNMTEVLPEIFDGKIREFEEFTKYQHITPERNFSDTVKSLKTRPEHPPLYYLIEYFWVKSWGSSVTVMRSLSAFISLLIFPSIYWLCWELFETPTVGWIAIALITVSPFHLLYAQEARQYSLWTVGILLSSAALLRSLRVKTASSWAIYAITMLLSLYSHTISILVAIAHSIYVLGIAGFRWSKSLTAYVITWLCIITIWMPWLVIFITNLPKSRKAVNWTEENIGKLTTLKSFLSQIRLYFVIDINDLENPHQKTLKILYNILTLLMLLLIGYSLYYLGRYTSRKSWLLIFLLVGINGLFLLLPDLIVGGIRSLNPRYLIPYYLGINLAVIIMIYHKMISPIPLQRNLGRGLIVTLISLGVISCFLISQVECPWSIKYSCDNITIARIIKKASHPLIITNRFKNNLGQLFSLSYKLDYNVKFQLLKSSSTFQIPEGFSDIFLYNISPILREEIARSRPFQIQSVYQGNNLKLEKLVPPK
jgi:uncharacterized membrane protein